MVRNDLRSRYRRSLLGVGWSLLHPIAMTVVFCTVFSTLFQVEIRTYAPFVLTGLTFWNFVATTMNQGCQCFFQNESYIRQHPAPLGIYPLRTTLGAGFHFLLGFGVSLIFVWCVDGFGNLSALPALIPAMLLLFVFGWALAVCVGMLNVLFQDAQHLVEVVLQVFFYVTPIMYPAQLLRERHLAWFVHLNPLAVLLELLRKPVLEGELPAPGTMALGVACALVAAAVAALMLRWFERRMIFYL
jgi:lipopolysaccharide transport system permease protein